MNCEYLGAWATKKNWKNWTLFHWGSLVSTFRIKECERAALPKSGRSSLKEQKLTTVAKKAFKKRDAAVGGNLRRVWFPGWRERYQDFAPSPSQDTKSQVRKCPLPQVKPTRQGLIFRNKWKVDIGGEVMAQHSKISSWLFKGWVFRKMKKLKFWRSFSVEFLNWVEGRPNFVFIFPLPCPKWKIDATWLTNDTQKFSAS